jgi:hypothetical protein
VATLAAPGRARSNNRPRRQSAGLPEPLFRKARDIYLRASLGSGWHQKPMAEPLPVSSLVALSSQELAMSRKEAKSSSGGHPTCLQRRLGRFVSTNARSSGSLATRVAATIPKTSLSKHAAGWPDRLQDMCKSETEKSPLIAFRMLLNQMRGSSRRMKGQRSRRSFLASR